MVADHREGLGGQGALLLCDYVHVLVVPPRDEDVVEAAPRRVYPVRGRVDGVRRVRVGGERLGVDVLVGEGSTDDEGVSDDVPLAFGADQI